MGDSDAVRALSRVQSRAGDRRRSAVLAGVLTLMLAAAGGCVARLADTDNAQDAAGKASWTDAEIEAMAREAREARPSVEQIEALIAQGRAPRPARTGQSRDVAIGLVDLVVTESAEEAMKHARLEDETQPQWIAVSGFRPLRSIETKELLEREGVTRDPVLAGRVERLMSNLAAGDTELMLGDLPGTDLPAVLEHARLFGRYSAVGGRGGNHAASYALAVVRTSVLTGDLPRFERASAALVALLEAEADTSAGGRDLGSMIFEELSLRVTAHMDFAARARPDAAWLESIDRTLERMPSWDAGQYVRWAEMAWLEYLCEFYSDPDNLRRETHEADHADGKSRDDGAGATRMTRVGLRTRERLRGTSFDDARAALREEAARVRSALRQDRWTRGHVSGFRSERPTPWSTLLRDSFGTFVSAPIAELSLRGVRVGVQVDRFRAQNGRLPTQAEYDAMLARFEWAKDPYSGGLLRYKVIDEPPSTIDRQALTIEGVNIQPRGYVIYSVGVDRIDNDGHMTGRTGSMVGMLRNDIGVDVRFPLLPAGDW